jgi:hypothetical protein
MNLLGIRRLKATVAIAALAIALPFAGANAAAILELDLGLSFGTGHLTDTNVSTGGSNAATQLQGAGNTICTVSSLTGPVSVGGGCLYSSVSSYNAIWVSNSGGAALGANSGVLSSYLTSGGKVVFLGESSTDGAQYGTWDTAIMGIVGGAVASNVSTATFVNPVVTETLTTGLAALTGTSRPRFASYGTLNASTGSPDILFDVATAGVYTVGGGQALVILDSSWMTNGSPGIPTRTGNIALLNNVSAWLNESQANAAPEPATLALLGAGMVGLFAARRRKRKA